MNIDKTYLAKLKENGITNEHVRSIVDLIDKLDGPYQVALGKGNIKPAYLFLHALADNKAVFQVDSKGMLWVQEALEKNFTKDKIANTYDKLVRLTGKKYRANFALHVNSWHDKVEELADILMKVVNTA